MNQKKRAKLQQAFEAPLPRKKEEFLKALPYPRLSKWQLWLQQAKFIKKRTWFSSIGLFFLLVFLCQRDRMFLENRQEIGMISALTPVFVLIASMEFIRSRQYNMEELEMSTRFSLGNVLLIRINLLGSMDLILFLLLMLFLAAEKKVACWQAGIYLLLPYLITSFLTLFAVCCLKTRDTSFMCAVISALVTIIFGTATYLNPAIYETAYIGVWLLAAGIFLLLLIRQIIILTRNGEQYVWNFQLTE
ncbi:MAG: hypothetical protein NC412_02590 [Roseburia sp.]|nr:hypothetical protein [Roseburia sp.]MCM1278160.1 hypothetical protein [Robinsoniella sp.]